ncbi:Lrp/AsnC ligand binding domain-containing protein [Devosia sp. MC532]|uniref:Lrp/AsnC family transcriptional regulator n=1 Tax=Devosia sp. MC532 TaxID=2799788 RepID=UPI0018F27C3E|nr:Lrp/AsnC ligand binding domain-containing protein [Devosia sp. MC532]MBJ7577693.1 Lrp/AsnC ligand binding domain-containing protein [Devosia sp. MC532]
MKDAINSPIDQIDRKILDELSKDGRISVTELSRRVNLSKTPCQARIKRLEDQGYILGYRAVIDPKRLGLPHVAFVEVKLSDTRKAALEAFNKAVRALPEVEQAHMIASSFDYLLKVRTKDIAAYREVLGEKLSALPHVAQTSTHVSMEAVKDDAE